MACGCCSSPPMTDNIEAIRRRHALGLNHDGNEECQHCRESWPCQTIQAVIAYQRLLDEAKAKHDQLYKDARKTSAEQRDRLIENDTELRQRIAELEVAMQRMGNAKFFKDVWNSYKVVMECRELRQLLADVQSAVNAQAEDEGLWFEAETAPEAYLQRALRELHSIIEKRR